MQYAPTRQIPLYSDASEVDSVVGGGFAQRVAVAAATIYTLFTVTIMLADRTLAGNSVIWFLWAFVIVVAAGTYTVGRFVSRRSLTAP